MISETVFLVDGRPLPLLTSSLIPASFVHGFTSRAGGVSAPPYQSLNLGMKWGDAPENVIENRRRVQVAVAAGTVYVATQVHGRAVVRVGQGADPTEIARHQADALWTSAPGAAVAVYVADCVPLLMADPVTGSCAAVHAGWRGVVAGVATAALAELQAQGARTEDVVVALGPSIGPCCFEVGPEVAEAFAGAEGTVIERPGEKPHVDLRLALRRQLAAAGVSRIDAEPPCTKCDPAGRFFSYRRDATRTGQHMGIILRR